LGKAPQLLFSASANVYDKSLQLVHIDVWGLAPVNASNGACYYISFLYAYSKYTWIFLLNTKSQVFATFKRFKIFC